MDVPQFSIWSPTEGPSGCFQVLAITNKAAINYTGFCVDRSFQFLLVNTREFVIFGSCSNSMFGFIRNCHTFSKGLDHFAFAPAVNESSCPCQHLVLSMIFLCSVTKSHPALCDPHELWHTRLPCPSIYP